MAIRLYGCLLTFVASYMDAFILSKVFPFICRSYKACHHRSRIASSSSLYSSLLGSVDVICVLYVSHSVGLWVCISCCWSLYLNFTRSLILALELNAVTLAWATHTTAPLSSLAHRAIFPISLFHLDARQITYLSEWHRDTLPQCQKIILSVRSQKYLAKRSFF